MDYSQDRHHTSEKLGNMLLLLNTLLLFTLSETHHCGITANSNLAVASGSITIKTPIHIENVEHIINSIRTELNIKEEPFSYVNKFKDKSNKTKIIYIPNNPSDTITSGRALCLMHNLQPATIIDLISSRIFEIYRKIVSVSYFLKYTNYISCNFEGEEKTEKRL